MKSKIHLYKNLLLIIVVFSVLLVGGTKPAFANLDIVEGCAISIVDVEHPFLPAMPSLYTVKITYEYIGADCGEAAVTIPFERAKRMATTMEEFIEFGGLFDVETTPLASEYLSSSPTTVRTATREITNVIEPRVRLSGGMRTGLVVSVGGANWKLVQGHLADPFGPCQGPFEECDGPPPDPRSICEIAVGGDCGKIARETIERVAECAFLTDPAIRVACAEDMVESSTQELTAEVDYLLADRVETEMLDMPDPAVPNLPTLPDSIFNNNASLTSINPYYLINDPVSVTWVSTGMSQVDIDLYNSSGTVKISDIAVVSSASASMNSYNWVIPSSYVGVFTIRVSDPAHPTVYKNSDQTTFFSSTRDFSTEQS